MKSFKVYLENKLAEILPSQGSLEDFLKTLEGKTISDVIDDTSKINMYVGNAFGIGSRDESASNAMQFTNALTNWVNRDVLKHNPEEREYDTDEFKAKNGFAEYEALGKKRLDIFRRLMKAKGEERNPIMDEKKALEREIVDSEYYRARKALDEEYHQAVKDYHNTPLTAEYLKDDGSELYDRLIKAFQALGGDSDNIVDV
jgi:hypothetical protein